MMISPSVITYARMEPLVRAKMHPAITEQTKKTVEAVLIAMPTLVVAAEAPMQRVMADINVHVRPESHSPLSGASKLIPNPISPAAISDRKIGIGLKPKALIVSSAMDLLLQFMKIVGG